MNLRKVLVVAASAAIAATVAAGCSSTVPDDQAAPSGSDAILAAYDLDGLDTRAVIDRLDEMPVTDRPQTLRASVRPDEVLLTDTASGAEATLDIPDDAFYLSIAPYINGTHECFYHSLTTCKGELGGQEVHVTITDKATGEVLVDETGPTFDNGFVGFWLPRDVEATLQVEHEGHSASADIGTGPDDPTCLTTLQLTA